MKAELSRTWWIWALRGLAAIAFGILAIVYPGEALTALVYVFGAYAVIDGAISTYHAVSNRTGNWGWELLEGILSIVAGIAAFVMPFFAFLTILFILAFWAITTGIVQMVMAWRLRDSIDNEIWLGLAGLMSVLFGVFIIFDPFAGSLATAWLIGGYSIVFGAMFLALAWRLHSLDEEKTVEGMHYSERAGDNI